MKKEIKNRNEQIAELLSSGERIKDFYRFTSQNPHIDLHDACQIVLARPKASICFYIDEWNEMGRRVTKNRKGIQFYDADGQKHYIYDLHDTHGDKRYRRLIFPMRRLLYGLDELNGTELAESNRRDYSKILSGIAKYLDENGYFTEDARRNSLIAEGVAYSLYSKTGFPKDSNISLRGMPYDLSENARLFKEIYFLTETAKEDIDAAYERRIRTPQVIEDIDEDVISDEPTLREESEESHSVFTEKPAGREDGSEETPQELADPEITVSTEVPEPPRPVVSEEEKSAGNPMYRRYMEAQREEPEAVVLNRVGDFYEVFGERAKEVAKWLDLTLTGRDCGLSERVPMCGFPCFVADEYIAKLLEHRGVVVLEPDAEPLHILSSAETPEKNSEQPDTERGNIPEETKELSERGELLAELDELFAEEYPSEAEQAEEQTESVEEQSVSDEPEEEEYIEDEEPEEDEEEYESDEEEERETRADEKKAPKVKGKDKSIRERKKKEKPQMTMFDLLDGPKEPNREEQLIESQLLRGSGVEDGKYRIYEKYFTDPTVKEYASFLKHEYGIGGYSYGQESQDHSGKGIRMEWADREHPENNIRIDLKWDEAAVRIADLIDEDKYLTAEEKEDYEKRYKPEQAEKQRQYAEEQRKKNEFVYFVIQDNDPDSKQRILDEYSQTTEIVAFAEFLKKEYVDRIRATSKYHARYDANGVWLSKYDKSGNTKLHVNLSWNDFAGKVCDLIEDDRLFSNDNEERLKQIADSMIETGIEHTGDGNYAYFFGTFGEEERFVKEHYAELAKALCSRPEIKNVYRDDWYIHVTYYKESCAKLKDTAAARQEHNERVCAIAERIIEDGTQNTTEGNWVVYFDELGDNGEFAKANAEEIAVELELRQEVSDVEVTPDAFDTNFYLDYCPNYIPHEDKDGYAEEPKVAETEQTPGKPIKPFNRFTELSPEDKTYFDEYIRKPYREPSNSPWDTVEECTVIAPGIYSVSTAGHGGIMIDRALALHILSPKALAEGFVENGCYCYEEDAAESIPLRELYDKGILDRSNIYFRERSVQSDRIDARNGYIPFKELTEAEKDAYLTEWNGWINESLAHWYPDYWTAYEQSCRTDTEWQVRRFVDLMVEEGTRETHNGDFYFAYNHYTEEAEQFAREHRREIAEELTLRKEVREAELSDDGFDVKFRREYCSYLDDISLSESKNKEGEQGENTDLNAVLDQSKLGGAKSRFKGNMDAIRLMNKLYFENREATDEERKVLAKYVGWGGLAQAFDETNEQWSKEYAELKDLLTTEQYEKSKGSVLNAHYTSKEVIGGIYAALERFGVKGNNRILEPAMGTGNFFGYMPQEISDGARLYGVELDEVTGKIAAKLYPQAKVQIKGFEETSFPQDYFDIVVGNVPFGGYSVYDSEYSRQKFMIHDYFIAKSIDRVKPNGIVAVVTSKGTMDKLNPVARKYMAERAELLGAIRLPNNAFKQTANTEAVTDILFFQKREERINDTSNIEWLGTGKTEDGFEVNNYFIRHPEMVLGTFAKETGLYGAEGLTVKPDGRDLGEALAAAVNNLPQNIYDNPAQSPADAEERESTDVFDVRPMCYIATNGNVYMRVGETLVKQELPSTPKDAYERIAGMIDLRNELRHVLDIQSEGCTDEALNRAQWKLNADYDRFVRKYGYINGQTNTRLFREDGDAALLFACEVLSEDKTKATKADIFTKRTIRPYSVPAHTSDTLEALQICRNERGGVDIAYIEELTGKDFDTVLSELGDTVYRDPVSVKEGDKYSGYQTAEEYLSGKVVEKLRFARHFAAEDTAYARNVAALEKVQPEPLKADEIAVRIGASWVKPEYYKQFLMELLDIYRFYKDDLQVRYNAFDSSWKVERAEHVRKNAGMNATEKYGTSRANAFRLFEDCLNQRATSIHDTVLEDGREKQVLNQAETIAAREKQNKIKEAFADWIYADPKRREDLEETYNSLFNQIRLPSYDGSYLKFPGMNPAIELRPHQKNAVARIAGTGNSTLLHHVVGSGKSFTMSASAMKLRQYGLAKKPMIVVPNHLVQQMANEFRTLYPTAKLLIANKEDLEKNKRKQFVSKVAMGDWDSVIIAQSSFAKIPVSRARQERMMREEIAKIEAAILEMRGDSGTRAAVKNLERIKKSREAMLKKLLDSGKKDDVLIFENLGVDYLFVDEADAYKNRFLYTKMNNVSGISNAASARASDMQLKIEYINELHGGDKGVVFATGTPISNSMAEMYIMQSYLQKNTLEELDINFFDGWAADFGETVTALEMAPSGQGYRARTRFAKFTNLPELMTLYRSFADVQTAYMVKLDVPEAERITVTLEPSEQTVQIAEEIAKRAEAIYGGSVDPHEDNMLKVTSDGKKLALDVRCFDPFLKDEGTGKLDICADNAAKVYEDTTAIRGTQLIFCDMSTPKKPYEEYEYGKDFDVYNDLKHKLIERGIPKEEIAFIHDAKTDKEKQALFDKMNEGRIRILIGSTEKCGAGTNVQKRLAALHHLDAPYRPRDLQQRDGRGIRQHNMNKSVKIFTYVKKRTLDSYCYQILENKQRFISQIENGSLTVREAEDIDETTLSYAEIKAITAANPKIKRKVELETELTRLRVLEGQYRKNLYALQDKTVKDLPTQIHAQEQLLKYAQEDEEHMRGKYNPDVFSINVLGKIYTDKKEGATALVEALRSNKYDTPVAEYGGFRISLNPPTVLTDTRSVSLTYHGSYDMEIGSSELGLITRMDNFMRDFPERKGRYSAKLEQLKRDLSVAEAELKKPFEHKGKIEETMKELSEINAELDLNKREEVVIDTEEENDDEEVNYMALPEKETDKAEPVKRPHKRMTEKQYKLYADYTAKFPDAVIFLKNGEFYETVGGEAKIAAENYGAATYEKELGGEKRIVAMLTYENLDAMVNALSEKNEQFKIVESEKEIDKETDFLETEEESKAIAETENEEEPEIEAEEEDKVYYSVVPEDKKYSLYMIDDSCRVNPVGELYATADEAREAAQTFSSEPLEWERIEVSLQELQEYASNMGTAAKVPVSVLPDYFVTQDEMHEYGYLWNGMLPLTKPAVRHSFQDCLLLYEDDTEGYGETEQRIEEHDGLFGIERPGWKKFIESENGKAYLAARQFASTAVMKMVGEEYSDTDEREKGEHSKFTARLKAENVALSNYFKDKWFPLPEAMKPYAENIVAEYAERIFGTYKIEARGKSEEDIQSELENRIGIPYFAEEKPAKEPGKNEYLDKMRETHDALPEYLAGLRVEYRSKDERFHLVTPPCAKALAEAGVHLYITENGRKKRLYKYPSWYTGETFLVDDEEWHNYLYTGRGAGYISARLVFVKAAKEITAETDGTFSDRLYTALNAEEEDLTAVMSRQEHTPTSEEQNEYFAALADTFVRYFAADEQYYKENWNKNPYALKNAIAEKIVDPILKAAVKAELFKKSKEDLKDNGILSCYVIEHNEKTGKYHYRTIEDYEVLVPSPAYDDERSCRAAAPKGMELADMEQLAEVSRIQYEVYPDYFTKEDDGQYYALTKRKAQQLMNLGLPICFVNDEWEYVTIQNQAMFDKQDEEFYIGKAEWYGFVRTDKGKAYLYARLLAAKAAHEMVSEELDYVGYYADSFMEVFYAEEEDLERCFARKSVPSDEAVKPYLYGLCREYASRIDGNGNLREYGWWYEDVIKAIAEKLPDRFGNDVERSANEEIKAIKPEKTYYAVIEKDGEWRLYGIDNYDTKVTYSKFQTEEKRTKYIEDMLSANSGLQFEEIPYEKLKETADEMKAKREGLISQNREVFLEKQTEEEKAKETSDVSVALLPDYTLREGGTLSVEYLKDGIYKVSRWTAEVLRGLLPVYNNEPDGSERRIGTEENLLMGSWKLGVKAQDWKDFLESDKSTAYLCARFFVVDAALLTVRNDANTGGVQKKPFTVGTEAILDKELGALYEITESRGIPPTGEMQPYVDGILAEYMERILSVSPYKTENLQWKKHGGAFRWDIVRRLRSEGMREAQYKKLMSDMKSIADYLPDDLAFYTPVWDNEENKYYIYTAIGYNELKKGSEGYETIGECRCSLEKGIELPHLQALIEISWYRFHILPEYEIRYEHLLLYGFRDVQVCPLTRRRAQQLYNLGMTVYVLDKDNKKHEIGAVTEITGGRYYGVDKAEWREFSSSQKGVEYLTARRIAANAALQAWANEFSKSDERDYGNVVERLINERKILDRFLAIQMKPDEDSIALYIPGLVKEYAAKFGKELPEGMTYTDVEDTIRDYLPEKLKGAAEEKFSTEREERRSEPKFYAFEERNGKYEISYVDAYNNLVTSEFLDKSEAEHELEIWREISEGLLREVPMSELQGYYKKLLEEYQEMLLSDPNVFQNIEEKGTVYSAPVAVRPDYSITDDEMREYGYKREEMLPLRERAAGLLSQKFMLPVYRLYQDNQASRTKNKSEIDSFGGIFGIEKTDWTEFLKTETARAYFGAMFFAASAASKTVNADMENVDARFTDAVSDKLFAERNQMREYLIRAGMPDTESMKPYLAEGMREYAYWLNVAVPFDYGWDEDSIEAAMRKHLEPKELKEYLTAKDSAGQPKPTEREDIRYYGTDTENTAYAYVSGELNAESFAKIAEQGNGADTFVIAAGSTAWDMQALQSRSIFYLETGKEIQEADLSDEDTVIGKMQTVVDKLTAERARESMDLYQRIRDSVLAEYADFEKTAEEELPYKHRFYQAVAEYFEKGRANLLDENDMKALEKDKGNILARLYDYDWDGVAHDLSDDAEITVLIEYYNENKVSENAGTEDKDCAKIVRERVTRLYEKYKQDHPDYENNTGSNVFYRDMSEYLQETDTLPYAYFIALEKDGENVLARLCEFYEQNGDLGLHTYRERQEVIEQYAKKYYPEILQQEEKPKYFGKGADGAAYYYLPQGLSHAALAEIKVKASEYIIAAPKSTLSKDLAEEYHITFLKTERDIPDAPLYGTAATAKHEMRRAAEKIKHEVENIEQVTENTRTALENLQSDSSTERAGYKERFFAAFTEFIEDADDYFLSAEDFAELVKDGDAVTERVYAYYMDTSDQINTEAWDELSELTKNYIDERWKMQKAMTEGVPLYGGTLEYAKANGERELYRHSLQANIECRHAIEQAIRNNFDGMHLNKGFENKLIEQFGMERVKYVLANTVQENDWDGRYSPETKSWAKGVTVTEKSEHRSQFVIGTHPAVLDGFINRVRKAEKAYEEQNEAAAKGMAKEKIYYAFLYEREPNGAGGYRAYILDENSGMLVSVFKNPMETLEQLSQAMEKEIQGYTGRFNEYIQIEPPELLEMSNQILREKEKGEEMQEGKYRTETKKGFPVVQIEKDRYGHDIAIVKRKDDYVVAIGYDVNDGTWAQGRYDFPTQEKAQEFIDEKYKPKTTEQSDKKWLTAKVSKDALIHRYERHSFFRMPNGEYEDYSYNVFNNRVKDGRQLVDLDSDGHELCYELVFPADGEVTIKTRDGDEVIFPAEEFAEIINGTANADYERKERGDDTTWYAVSVPQEALRGTYEKSSLFSMPSKGEFAGCSYYIPNVFVEEDKRGEDGNILITLPDDFHVTLRNRITDEEIVVTPFEIYTECDGTKGEDYARKQSETEGDAEKKNQVQVTIPAAAKIAEYKTQTLFKMPHTSEYDGYCFYLFNDQLSQDAEAIKAKLSENFTVQLKDKKNDKQATLTAEQFKAIMDEVSAEDFSGGLKKPSEEKEDLFKDGEKLLRKNIPEEMLSRPNWVAVKVFRDKNKDKLVKLPKDAKTGEAASPLDPSTWSDFDTACKFAHENGCAALAYALDGKDNICCIDIDHCFNVKREMSDIAKTAWNACGNTYREVSVSREGLHIFGKTDGLGLQVFSDAGDMEFYERGKFMTVTGDAFGESKKNLLNLNELPVRDLLSRKFSKHKTYSWAGKGIEGLSSMSDREVLEKAFASKDGATFKALFNGEDLKNNHSNSDMALMVRLAFWCNGDKDQMLRIFAASGLYRPDKSPEYFEYTALKAVRENPNRYEPKPLQSNQTTKPPAAKKSEGNSK